jgi:outer membrane protein assembly factor BamB
VKGLPRRVHSRIGLAPRMAMIAALVALAGGCDWPMFRFGPAHTGSSPDTSITKDAVASGSLALKWTGTLGDFPFSSSAVAGGKVYVGAQDGKLYAFDATGGAPSCAGSPATCSPLWTATTDGPLVSSPAVKNGVVYVGSCCLGAVPHKLYAFDAAGTTNCSGSPKVCAPLWTATTGGDVPSSPTVSGNVVYVASDDRKLYAFDAAGTTNCSGSPKTCAPLWTAETFGNQNFTSPAWREAWST